MIALRVFLPFSLGFFLSYAVRNVNAVIAPDLTASLSLTPADLGMLTSAYFLTFAAFQLPLGLLLDRYGPRRVEAALMVVAAAGCGIFALGLSIPTLVIGRALIGLGMSACLMAAFKAYVQWFPAERLPIINGATLAIGGFGALTATAPVEVLLSITDWRGVLLLTGAVSLVAAAAIFTVVPKHAEEGGIEVEVEGWGDQLRGLAQVLSSPYFWRIAPITLTVQSALLAIQGLWVGPWMRDIGGFDRVVAANHLLYITVAMTAGFLVLGILMERLERFGVSPVTFTTGCCVAATAALGVIVLAPGLPPALTWCTFGFFGGAGILYYPVLSRHFPTALAGRVITSANVLSFGGAFAAQWGIGEIIELWPVADDGSYHRLGYQAGFGLIFGLEVLALVWLLIPRRSPDAHL